MPFGDVTNFRAKSGDREENAWVLGCAAGNFRAHSRVLFARLSLSGDTGRSLWDACGLYRRGKQQTVR